MSIVTIRLFVLVPLLVALGCKTTGYHVKVDKAGSSAERQFYTTSMQPTHVFRYSNQAAYKIASGGQFIVGQELADAVSRAKENPGKRDVADLGGFTKAGLGAYAASDMNSSSDYGDVLADLVLKSNVQVEYIDVDQAQLNPMSEDRAIVSDPTIPVIAYEFDSFVPLHIAPPGKKGLAIVIRDINVVDVDKSTVIYMRTQPEAPELDWTKLPVLPPPTSLQQAMRDGFGEPRTHLFEMMNHYRMFNEFAVHDNAIMLSSILAFFPTQLEAVTGIKGIEASGVGMKLAIYAQFKQNPQYPNSDATKSVFAAVGPAELLPFQQAGLLNANDHPEHVEEFSNILMSKLRATQPDFVAKIESYVNYLNYYRSQVQSEGMSTWSEGKALKGDALRRAVADAHAKGLNPNVYSIDGTDGQTSFSQDQFPDSGRDSRDASSDSNRGEGTNDAVRSTNDGKTKR